MSKAKIAVGGGAVALLLGGAFLVSVKEHEGRRHVAYYDTGGVLTVCDGSTGPHVRKGRYYTDEECDHLLAMDLEKHDILKTSCLTNKAIPDRVRAAVSHWTYNVGVANACRSTLVRKLNQGDLEGACNEFSKWVYVAGKDCRIRANNCYGIVKRREREKQMCLGQWP